MFGGRSVELDGISYFILKLNPVELIFAMALDIDNDLGNALAEVLPALPLIQHIKHLVSARQSGAAATPRGGLRVGENRALWVRQPTGKMVLLLWGPAPRGLGINFHIVLVCFK